VNPVMAKLIEGGVDVTAVHNHLLRSGSVMLHEIYFESLGGYGDNPPTGLVEPPAALAQALGRDFGSVTAWRDEFSGIVKALD
jgi:Fe-Mn family superoxide dismutase